MADVLAGRGIDDDHAAIAVAVGDVHAVVGRIDRDVGGQIELRRAVAAAVLVVAVRPLGARTADHHHELAVLGEFQDHAVGAVGRRPGRAVRIAVGAVAAEIDEAVVVDEDAVLAGRPDAAVLPLALVGIGRAAPGAQQLSVRIELHHRRRRQAAVAKCAVGARIAERVDGLSVLGLVGGAGQRRLVVGQRARPLVDPDVIVGRDVEAADLADDPVVGQLLRPAGVGDEARRLRGRRHAVDAGALGEPLQNAGPGERRGIGLRGLGSARGGNKSAEQRAENGQPSSSHVTPPREGERLNRPRLAGSISRTIRAGRRRSRRKKLRIETRRIFRRCLPSRWSGAGRDWRRSWD